MEEKNGTLGNQTGVFWVPSPNLSTIAAGGGNDLVGLLKPPLFKLSKTDFMIGISMYSSLTDFLL